MVTLIYSAYSSNRMKRTILVLVPRLSCFTLSESSLWYISVFPPQKVRVSTGNVFFVFVFFVRKELAKDFPNKRFQHSLYFKSYKTYTEEVDNLTKARAL